MCCLIYHKLFKFQRDIDSLKENINLFVLASFKYSPWSCAVRKISYFLNTTKIQGSIALNLKCFVP